MKKKKRRFGIVDADVMQDPDLSLRAKGLYALLASYADKNRRCFPKINTLAEYSGVSRRTIERTLNELENKNYVTRKNGAFQIK
jgi:DNA-binding MarR family transcriptional regulator